MLSSKKRKTKNASAGLKQAPLKIKAKPVETASSSSLSLSSLAANDKTASSATLTAASSSLVSNTTAFKPLKKSKFGFEALIALTVFVIVFAIVFYFLTIPQEQEFAFQASQEGVLFVSNIEMPSVFLVKLRSQDSFLISPAFSETAASNTFASNALVLFNTVLISKQKQAISLLREVQNNELLYCRTNRGNAKTDERIETQECVELMNDKNKVLILIELPNSELEQSKVILEPNRIEIMPKKNSDITLSSYLVLKTMYSDSDETIRQINAFLAQIQGQ